MRAPPHPRRRFCSLAASTLSAPLLAACGVVRLTHRPIPVDWHRSGSGTAPSADLLVLLPGSYTRPADFVQEGYVAAVRERGWACDIAIPDAHVGYYAERSIVDRLHEDVIAPARARGARRVVLAGISIGGLGALLYADAHRDVVSHVALIAPYLGGPQIAHQVDEAGGLERWRASNSAGPSDDDERIWLALKSLARPTMKPSMTLAWGRSDRFAANHRVLSKALPPSRRFETPGGHDWPTWRTLWQQMLDARVFEGG